VTYTLTIAGTPVFVSCSAQSTGTGTQYTTATSQSGVYLTCYLCVCKIVGDITKYLSPKS